MPGIGSTHEERVTMADCLSWDACGIHPDDVKEILSDLRERGYELRRLPVPSGGEGMKSFVCTYMFQGRPHGVTVEARDFDELSARLRAIGMTAVMDGELVAEIDGGIIGEGLGRMVKGAQDLSRKLGIGGGK